MTSRRMQQSAKSRIWIKRKDLPNDGNGIEWMSWLFCMVLDHFIISIAVCWERITSPLPNILRGQMTGLCEVINWTILDLYST